MKKGYYFLVFYLFLILLFPLGCEQDNSFNFNAFLTSENINDNNGETISSPSIGPGYKDEGESDGNLPSVAASFTSSVIDGEKNVEVNKPIEITFEEDIDHKSVTPETFFLKNSSNDILYFRIVRDCRTFILIPRVPLQQGRDYTVIMRGLRNTKGERIKTIKISYTNRDLDYGLYWYGKNGLCEKYFPEYKNAFYDDDKRTVILAHGLETGLTSQYDDYGRKGFNRETFFWSEKNFKKAREANGLKIFVNNPWVDSGWNTGILYWTQFADDIDIWAVESKIWTFDRSRGPKYKYLNKNDQVENRIWDRKITFKDEEIVIDNITDLLGIYMLDAIRYNTSGDLRLVGHSFGSQLVCRLTKKCFDNNIIINRIALLEPAWTAYGKKYLGDQNRDGKNDWVGEICRKILFDAIEAMKGNLAVEIYHTTGLNLGIPIVDDNSPLTNKVCDVNILPKYYGTMQLQAKHVAARHHYFWSYAFPPPVQCETIQGVCWEQGAGPSASTKNEDIIEMMTEKYEWTQVGGLFSPEPSDDIFERKKKESGFFGSTL